MHQAPTLHPGLTQVAQPSNRGYAGHLQQSPRQNRLLAELPDADYARLLPTLQLVHLTKGQSLHRAGEREHFLHFLVRGVVGRSCITADGASSGNALTGRDGAIGISLWLGGQSNTGQAEVVAAGDAYRMSAGTLNREFEQHDALRKVLLRYTQALMAQFVQAAACNRHHTVEQRLCTWLLMFGDSAHTRDITITHGQIGELLGIRRESITAAAGRLQKGGAIQYTRGQLSVLDRTALKYRACECYGAVRREQDRLFPDANGEQQPRSHPSMNRRESLLVN